ncbi:Glucose-repressible alcohol dehydrogenase transcriptional effector [Cladochytrium tenue]|nr:Glucose-repressible alcohol dehydrogenase transcriptional effector [Cladochytrium tenue]
MDSASMRMVDWVVGSSNSEGSFYELFDTNPSRSSLFGSSFNAAGSFSGPAAGPSPLAGSIRSVRSNLPERNASQQNWGSVSGLGKASIQNTDREPLVIRERSSVPAFSSSISSTTSSRLSGTDINPIGGADVDILASLPRERLANVRSDLLGTPFEEELELEFDPERFEAGMHGGVSWSSNGSSMAAMASRIRGLSNAGLSSSISGAYPSAQYAALAASAAADIDELWKKGGTEKADNRHFMVMSYNILAPMRCAENPERHTVSEFLNWEVRREKILDEIAFYAPDFELPASDFAEVFQPRLRKIGFEAHYQQKKKDGPAEGCAIFYLEARFSLLAVQAFAYCDQVPTDPSSDLYQRLGKFSNVALIGVFQNRHARSLRVRIVNTHLHWDPSYADTKLLQAAILMEWLERSHRDIPTVIAADLNSRPGEAVVDYLVRGKVAPGPIFADRDQDRYSATLALRSGNVPLGPAAVAAAYANVQRLQHPVPAQPASGAAGSPSSASGTLSVAAYVPQIIAPAPPPLLRHGTKLASAYDRKDLPYTHKRPDYEGVVDHILYTSGTLSIRDVLADFRDSGYTASAPTMSLSDQADGSVSHLNIENQEASASLEDSTSGVERPLDATPVSALLPDGQAGDGDAQFSVPYAMQGAPPVHHGHLSDVPGLPSKHIPSDHLPLIAWLKWKTVPVGTGPMLAAAGALGGGANRNRSLSNTSAAAAGGGPAAPMPPVNPAAAAAAAAAGGLAARRFSSAVGPAVAASAAVLNGFGTFQGSFAQAPAVAAAAFAAGGLSTSAPVRGSLATPLVAAASARPPPDSLAGSYGGGALGSPYGGPLSAGGVAGALPASHAANYFDAAWRASLQNTAGAGAVTNSNLSAPGAATASSPYSAAGQGFRK